MNAVQGKNTDIVKRRIYIMGGQSQIDMDFTNFI
jgi:hypothetical protein